MASYDVAGKLCRRSYRTVCFLERVPTLGALTRSQLRALAAACVVQRVERGALVIRQDNPAADSCYFIRSGSVNNARHRTLHM